MLLPTLLLFAAQAAPPPPPPPSNSGTEQVIGPDKGGVDDALGRLKAEGIVKELPGGALQTLPPREAALHIDKLWDASLDNLPDMVAEEGREIDRATGAPATT